MGLHLAVLAELLIGARDVEVAQARRRQAVGLGVGGEHVVDRQLRGTVGVRRSRGHVLRNGHLFRFAIAGSGGGEDDVLHACFAHRVQQREGCDDIVVPVGIRLLHGFAHERSRGEVEDGGEIAIRQNLAGHIGNVAFHEVRLRVDRGPIAGAQVIHDGDVESVFNEDSSAHAAHVARTTGDEDVAARFNCVVISHCGGFRQ